MPGSKPLRGRIPRGLADHRTKAGKLYTGYVRGLLGSLGPLPPGCEPMLKQAGRLMLEIASMENELDKLMERRRLTSARRIRRSLTGARVLLVRTEERLEAIAAAHQSKRANGAPVLPADIVGGLRANLDGTATGH